MLIHKAGGKVSEDGVKKILTAAGVKVDEARVKALVAALDGVNIDEAIQKAAVTVAAPAAAPVEGAPAARKVDDKKKVEDEKKSEEQAAAGLGALFG